MLVILFMNVIAPLIDYWLVKANIKPQGEAPCRRLDSTRYTILFATAVCVVCALLVAVVGGRPARAAGEQRARSTGRRTCCSRPASSSPDEELSDRELQAIFDENIASRLIDLEDRRDRCPRARSTPRTYDQRKARNDPAQSRAAPPNAAQVSRLPNVRRRLLRHQGRQGRPLEQVVLPIEGIGMWGTLYGFIARRPRRQHGARPHLLRPEGDAGPGRRDRQPEVAGAVARPQGLRRQLGAASSP